jgi:uncharacterized protein (TIGR00299 family) protein
MIGGAGLPERVARRATAVFESLGRAEARVHGTDPAHVHLHEVGAVDALVDIVGHALALEHLDVDAVRFGTLEPGHGTIEAAHGVLPVPAPATLELLTGVPIRLGGERGEWVTPTGAALLTTLGRSVARGPRMAIEQIGIGAGSRQRRDRPNIVRALIGTSLAGADPEGVAPDAAGEPGVGDEVVVLQAAIDDQTPEAIAHAAERLREAGALDVTLTPLVMKKGRQGVGLEVLAPVAAADLLARRILAETTTLGVRLRREERRVLPRAVRTVSTPFGPIRVKTTRRPGGAAAAGAPGTPDMAPEAADVAAAARRAGVAFHQVAAAALSAARESPGSDAAVPPAGSGAPPGASRGPAG